MELNVKTFTYQDDGQVPNHPDLPAILYEGVFKDGSQGMEGAFSKHNWTNTWRGDVLEEHHYHGNTHEVLGVTRGNATLLVGGDEGDRLNVTAGDVLVLPAGTAHMKVESSDDFEVVGAYPEGMQPDKRERDPEERNEALHQIKDVPIPDTDPVFGFTGPLLENWKA